MPEHIIDTAFMEIDRKHEIVRCRDCRNYCDEDVLEDGFCEPPTCTLGYALSHIARYTHPDGYCAWGERKEAE